MGCGCQVNLSYETVDGGGGCASCASGAQPAAPMMGGDYAELREQRNTLALILLVLAALFIIRAWAS